MQNLVGGGGGLGGRQTRCIMGNVQVALVLCLRLRADCKLSICLPLTEMWQCLKYRQVVKWVEISMCIVTSFYQSCPLPITTADLR